MSEMSEEQEMLQQRETLQTLQHLNEEIVKARRQGAHEEVSRLKQKVRTLLALQRSSSSRTETQATPVQDISARQPTSLAEKERQTSSTAGLLHTTGTPESPVARKEKWSGSTGPSFSESQDLMQQLQVVNEKIVAARRQGDEDTVHKLQAQAKDLMKPGTQGK